MRRPQRRIERKRDRIAGEPDDVSRYDWASRAHPQNVWRAACVSVVAQDHPLSYLAR